MPPAPEEKKEIKNSKKWIPLVLGIIFALILLGTLGYVIWHQTKTTESEESNNSDDTEEPAKKLTYANDNYPGFTFDYDTTWELTENETPGYENTPLETTITLKKEGYSLIFTIEHWETSGCETVCYSEEMNVTEVYEHLTRIKTASGYKYDTTGTIRGKEYSDNHDIDYILDYYLSAFEEESADSYSYCSSDCASWIISSLIPIEGPYREAICGENSEDCNYIAEISAELTYSGKEDPTIINQADSIVLSVATTEV